MAKEKTPWRITYQLKGRTILNAKYCPTEHSTVLLFDDHLWCPVKGYAGEDEELYDVGMGDDTLLLFGLITSKEYTKRRSEHKLWREKQDVINEKAQYLRLKKRFEKEK